MKANLREILQHLKKIRHADLNTMIIVHGFSNSMCESIQVMYLEHKYILTSEMEFGIIFP